VALSSGDGEVVDRLTVMWTVAAAEAAAVVADGVGEAVVAVVVGAGGILISVPTITTVP